jgi:hypothetical protein
VYFGSPSPGTGGGYTDTGQLIFGTLTYTPVTVGGKTAIELLVRNDGGQSLNKVKFAGGMAADLKPYNPLYPRPDLDGIPGPDPSFPANTSVAAIYPQAAGTSCDPSSGASIECSVGTLAAGAFATFIIVISPPATAGLHKMWLTISWNEGWSSTGSNADYQFATAAINVGGATCVGASGYFLADEDVSIGNSGPATCPQQTTIETGSVGGNGTFANVTIADSTACPPGYKCFGKASNVTVFGGEPVDGGVEWTVRWEPLPVNGQPKGVIHFGDTYPTDPSAFDPILFNKQGECTATKLTECWTSIDSTRTYFEATFVTASNGGVRGTLK